MTPAAAAAALSLTLTPPPPLLRLPVMVKDLPLAVVLISGLYFGGCWMSLALLPIGVIIALTSAILWMAFLKL